MAQELYKNLNGLRICVAGAGVTGLAVARSLTKRGVEVTLIDENKISTDEFPVVHPDAITITDFDRLLISPGWKESHPVIQAARAAQVPLINEVDYAWSVKKPAQKWISLTGTNGKTSTVELTAAMLQAGGVSAVACGNVGTTVIESVESLEDYQFLVIELSSFQLHWMEDASFIAAAILNIAQDHIDWHGSFDAYAGDKISILDRATTAILNGEDGEIVTRVAHWQGQKVFFSLDTPGPGEIGIVEELLVDRAFVSNPQEAAMIAELNEVKPTVPHSVSNALAAAGLALTAGVAHEALRSAISTFTPGRHRIEKVYESDGVTWIDDSKATNPHAASASIMSALSVIWVAGGLAKGAEMGELIERIKARVRVAILIGEDRVLIADELRQRAPHIQVELIDSPAGYSKGGVDNSLMDSVIRTAKAKAVSGDTVLLAPACASMDQFLSYSDRGDRFKKAVEKVVRDGK
jgi:UDP-N-acetylmuramoylalanine--D-glutamate ligase